MPRRLAAIMFTDIAGYTALSQKDEHAALRLLRDQERLVRGLLEVHRGRWVKAIGDGLLIEFGNALDAVECAVDLQRHIQERNAREAPPDLRVRIGIHLGDVEEDGTDILGDSVNVASRIEPLAEPGGVCLSEPVYGLVRNKVSFQMESLGVKTLKGVQAPLAVYRVVVSERAAIGETPAPATGPPRLAVLPLVNISHDPENEYFADGMTEELIATLSKVRELSVISRTSVMQYKNQSKRMAEIGRELDAGMVLEGSVRKAGDRVRIAVQLIDAVRDKHLWAENYDQSLKDVFSVQSEIAQRVAAALQVRLLDEDKERLAKAPTSVTEAHLLYLKGRHCFDHYTREEFETAIEFYEQAIRKDPNYALAFAAMSDAAFNMGWFEMGSPRDAIFRATAAARRALELDPFLPEAHLAMADALFSSWDFEGFGKEVRRALELNPNLAEAHMFAAYVYVYANPPRQDEGLREVEEALKLDPLSVNTLHRAGTVYLYARRTEKAVELFEKALQADPGCSIALTNLGLAHVRQGLFDIGLAEIKKAIQMSLESNPVGSSDLVYALVRAGRIGEAREALTEMVTRYEKQGRGARAIACAHASLGDREEAFAWLEKAYAEHSPGLASVIGDFALDELRSDTRFQGFLKKMGFPTEPTAEDASRPRPDRSSPI